MTAAWCNASYCGRACTRAVHGNYHHKALDGAEWGDNYIGATPHSQPATVKDERKGGPLRLRDISNNIDDLRLHCAEQAQRLTRERDYYCGGMKLAQEERDAARAELATLRRQDEDTLDAATVYLRERDAARAEAETLRDLIVQIAYVDLQNEEMARRRLRHLYELAGVLDRVSAKGGA